MNPQLLHLLLRSNKAGKAPSFLCWHHWERDGCLVPTARTVEMALSHLFKRILAAHSEWAGHCYTSQASLALRQTKHHTDNIPVPSISSNFIQSGRGTPTWQPAPRQLTEAHVHYIDTDRTALPSPCAALRPAAFSKWSPLLPTHCSSCSYCSCPPLLALVPAICCQFLDKSHPQTSSFCLLHCPLPLSWSIFTN